MILYRGMISLQLIFIAFVGVTVSVPAPKKDHDLCNLPDNRVQEVTGTCNFNNGLCGYTFPSNLWYIHTESFGGLIYGRVTGDDHGQNQTFALFQSNDPKVNESMTIASQISSPTVYEDQVCLKFWYLMPNQNSIIDVFMRTIENGANVTSLVYEYKYKPTSQWAEVKLLLNATKPFQIDFTSVRENNYGYVGIDHIQVITEKVFTTTTLSTTPTTQISAATTTIPTTTTTIPTTTTTTTIPTTTTTIPTTTTTIPTTTTTTTTNPTTTTTITIPTTTTTTTTTTTIPTTTTTTTIPTTTTTTTIPTTTTTIPTTTTTAATTTTTTIPTTTTTIPTTTTTIPTTTTTQETTTYPDVETTADCSCNCPTVPTVCSGSEYITTAPSPPTVCDLPVEKLSVLDQYSCSFDNGLCGYDLPIYPHLWERTSYRYGDPAVGELLGDSSPEQRGGYMVFNTYNNHVQNHTSHILATNEMLPFTDYCVSFWYNMPTNQSVLQVFVTVPNTNNRTQLWSSEHVPTKGWTNVKIAVFELEPFILEFVGTKQTELSYFAVDDVRISIARPHIKRSVAQTREIEGDPNDIGGACACTCPSVNIIDCSATTLSPDKQFLPCSELPDAVLESTMSCDFDGGSACSYNIPTYPHLWELVRYRYGNNSVGTIKQDSSSKDGYGMYVVFATDNFHVPVGDRGEIISPTFHGNGSLCMSFQYNMPTLASIFSVYTISTGHRRIVFDVSKELTGGWKEANIFLNMTEPFQVAFSSQKNSLDGYFGIDDIRLYSNV